MLKEMNTLKVLEKIGIPIPTRFKDKNDVDYSVKLAGLNDAQSQNLATVIDETVKMAKPNSLLRTALIEFMNGDYIEYTFNYDNRKDNKNA